MAASLASFAICLRKLLARLSSQGLEPTMIYCENKSCVKLTKNPLFHDKSKHIEIRYHFIRDRVQKGAVKLQYISTYEKSVDVFVASGNYSHIGLDVGHVGILVGTHITLFIL